ncbi:MAG: hypothetical protein JNK11_14020 [Alphaproteobacteria bacterium]|nr:hypothetical protein [Alphaproteobacteria bacterium]
MAAASFTSVRDENLQLILAPTVLQSVAGEIKRTNSNVQWLAHWCAVAAASLLAFPLLGMLAGRMSEQKPSLVLDCALGLTGLAACTLPLGLMMLIREIVRYRACLRRERETRALLRRYNRL